MENKSIISNKAKFKGNPRFISKDQFKNLKEHLEDLGDMSGVVYCHQNKAYVGGNQRSEVFNGAKIEITEQFKEPTQCGTLAHGFVIYKKEKYTYREVLFSEKDFKKACIVANNDGGTFDWDILANEWDQEELNEWGMETPDEWGEDQQEEGEVKDLIESMNFQIKCESIEQLEQLQTKLNTSSQKISYNDFLIKAGL